MLSTLLIEFCFGILVEFPSRIQHCNLQKKKRPHEDQ
jgi:hypothetical protein